MTMTLDDVRSLADAIRAETAKAIVGQEALVEMLLVAMLSEGHVLLEGPPGTAKTFLANAFATALGLDFGRIQFTPDLLPGDILGSNLFNFQTSQFTLTRGPIFRELLLADEINRTPPKTQAALLEAMQERRVTLDGDTHLLPDRFMVIATQNPIENQGVYPLPEAQLDRFLFKLLVPYPAEEEEARIVTTFGQRSGPQRPADLGVQPVTNAAGLGMASAALDQVTVAEEIVRYVVRLVRATREHAELTVGASGERRPRPRRARGARLCDPRRRQGARRAGAAPPPHPFARRRDRGARHGDARRGTGRSDGSAPLA
jgi:MoxR-like ATPase